MRRKLTLIICAVLTALALSSCASTLPARFNSFANTVERRADTYTPKQWERKNDRFVSLCNEYKENFKTYSASDRRTIHNSMAKYAKSAAKSGVITIVDIVDEITQQITSLVDDAKALFESLGIGSKKK